MPRIVWIGVPEFAKQVGMTPQYIRRLIRDGKITEKSLKPHGKRYLVNPKKAIEEMVMNTSYQAHQKPVEHTAKGKKETNKKETNTASNDTEKQQIVKAAGLTIVPLAEAQKLQANYAAALKKLDLEERRGDLISKATVEKEAFEMARRVRDAILNIPNRISAELAIITDPHLITDKLNTEITAALEELSS